MSKQNARERMHQRRDQQRKQTQVILVVVVAVLALGVVGLLIAFNKPREPLSFPSGNYSGVPESVDQSGAVGFVLGSPSAPVTLTEYSDFSCPHCHELEPTIQKLIDSYVRPGQLKLIYKTVTFVGAEYSEAAARGMICAGAQSKAWEMHDQIWDLYAARTYSAYTESGMSQLAGVLSLDQAKFSSCYNSASTTDAIQSVSTEVQKIGVNGTPTLFLDGARIDYQSFDDILNAVKQKVASSGAAGGAAASPTP